MCVYRAWEGVWGLGEVKPKLIKMVPAAMCWSVTLAVSMHVCMHVCLCARTCTHMCIYRFVSISVILVFGVTVCCTVCQCE